MTPIIAKDTYRILKATLGPWLKANGFKSGKESWPVYRKALDGTYLTIKFRCHGNGWEKYKGSSFAVWFKHSPSTEVDDSNRHALSRLMTLPEREFIRARQNRILASIPPPPPDYVATIVDHFQKTFREPAEYIALFLKDWKPVIEPYDANSQIWLRYTSEEDVRAWALFLLNHISKHHDRVLSEDKNGVRGTSS